MTSIHTFKRIHFCYILTSDWPIYVIITITVLVQTSATAKTSTVKTAYTKTWSGVRLWCGVTFWSDFLEWDFGATFWSMIGLTKVISPMKRRCDLSVTPKIFGMKASSIPLRPSLVSRTCRDL